MKTKSIKTLALRIAPCLLSMGIMLGAAELYADFGLPMPDVYNFGPEGRPMEAFSQDYAKPNQMMEILPNQPVAAHNKDGSMVYYTADGAITCSVGVDGSMTFSMGSQMSKSYDTDGNLTQQTQLIKGTDRVQITNGEGQVTGYEQLGYGGKVVQTFDAQNNLTQTYQYNQYGTSPLYVLNELTLTKTYFNAEGSPSYDVDFTGAKVACYNYDSSGRLENKVDQYGNTTYYNQYGNMTYTVNSLNQKLCQYNYVTDDQGRYVLDNMVNLTPGVSGNDSQMGDVTYFQDGRAMQTISSLGGVATQYHYNGTQLVYTFDSRNNEVNWYDLNGNQTCSTLNGNVVQEYLYYKSRLVGVYDDQNQTVTMYQYEREDQTAQIFQAANKPTAAEIESYYQSQGLMTDIGASAADTAITVPTFISNLYKTQQTAANQLAVNQTNTAFNVLMANSDNPMSPNSGLIMSEMFYSDAGQLQAVVSQDPNDGSGWSTTVYIGQGDSSMGSDSGQTSITLSGDQSANIALASQLWSAITQDNQSISEIASGGGDLASFAGAVKSINVSAPNISRLSAGQVCNLFGWDINGAGTAQDLLDVKARANNAGTNGAVTITYGYNSSDGPIYACEVSASDANGFAVGGTAGLSKMLDLSRPGMYNGVLRAAPSGAAVPPDINALDELWAANSLNNQGISSMITSNVVTVNGVTRTYAANGDVIQERDSILCQVTNYDSCARVSSVYSYGILQQSYAYNDNGSLQSVKTAVYDNNKNFQYYTTTFYVGFGNSQFNQPSITVFGDQTGGANAALANQLWNAINNGQSIAAIAMGNGSSPALAAFTNTVQSISVNNGIMMNLTDALASNLFGLDVHGLIVNQNLSVLRNWAGNMNDSDNFTISYYNADKGIRGIFAGKIEAENSTLYLNSLPELTAAGSVLSQTLSASLLGAFYPVADKTMFEYYGQ